ncbi:MAG: aldehyde dehydrogenase family protein [Nocardioides sp.]|nr:aldehyde dehydrogenase family protein [Nocardioides sp.]
MTRYHHLIGGERIAGEDGPDNINPSDLDDVVGVAPDTSRELARHAIETAAATSASWGNSSIERRAHVLNRAATEVHARRDELGELLAREEGKPLREAVAEATRAANLLSFFSGEALRVGGEIVPSVREGMTVEVTREPLGVVGVITPWNFPIAIPTWKIAPAIAWGNTVVFKPAENTPGCAAELVDILHRAGLPDGVVNLVYGKGSEVGDAILSSPLVDGVSFTGSAGVGDTVVSRSAQAHIRVQAEMGGKNPLVVVGDADVPLAVNIALSGAYHSTGQRCTASSRIIVTDDIHDRFAESFLEGMQRMRVGHALDETTEVGPVVDQRQLDQDLNYLDIARREGGQVVGGHVVERDTRGHFLTPAAVLGATPDMTVSREEVFGPVASIIRVADYDEALTVANETEFGLSSGICTSSLAIARDYMRRARAGMVMVNAPTAGVDYHVPFGGTKRSSYGPREQGAYARDFYSTVKTAYVNPGGIPSSGRF